MLITLKLITKFEKRSLMKKLTEKEYVAPWEKAFSKVLTPLEEFIHRQTTSGILLMLWLYQCHALVDSIARTCRVSALRAPCFRAFLLTTALL